MALSVREIETLEEQVSPLANQANSYVVDSAESVEVASLFLKQVKDAETSIENKRVEFTGPLNQSLKAINDTFKKLRAPLEDARATVSGKIMAWRLIEREIAEKEEARRRAIQAAHEKAGHQVSAPVVMPKPMASIGNTQVRKVWKWKVVDFHKVPDSMKAIDNVAVNNSVRLGVREIPGIEVYQEEQLSIVGR